MSFPNLKLVSTQSIKCTVDVKDYDFDRYEFESKLMSTKEIAVTVSYIEDDKTPIEGDIIAFGDWGDLELEDCLECLRFLQDNNLNKREISHFLAKYESEVA